MDSRPGGSAAEAWAVPCTFRKEVPLDFDLSNVKLSLDDENL